MSRACVVQPVETFETFVHEIIVPAGDKICGCFYVGISILHAVGFPEIVEGVVSDHLSIERTVADAIKGGDQRQPSDRPPPSQSGLSVRSGLCGHRAR